MSHTVTRSMAVSALVISVAAFACHIYMGQKEQQSRAIDLALTQQLADELLREKHDRLTTELWMCKIIDGQSWRIDHQDEQLRVLNKLVAHMPTPPGSPGPHVTVDRDDSPLIPRQNLPTKPKE